MAGPSAGCVHAARKRPAVQAVASPRCAARTAMAPRLSCARTSATPVADGAIAAAHMARSAAARTLGGHGWHRYIEGSACRAAGPGWGRRLRRARADE